MTKISEQILITLLAAHFIGDFVFQTKRSIENKKNIKVFLSHVLINALLSYVLTGLWNIWILPAVIFVTHASADLVKIKTKRDSIGIFLTDQGFHLFVIFLLTFYLTNFSQSEFAVTRASSIFDGNIYCVEIFGEIYLKILIMIISIIVSTKVSGIIIGYLLKPFQPDTVKINRTKEKINEENNVEIKAGRMIGYLERLIILILYLSNSAIGIGFLITAKSILRFGEIKEGNNDKIKQQIEYVLIGTFMSFALGISAGVGARYFLVQ